MDQHRRALEAAPTGIVLLDAEGVILWANPAAAAALRTTPEEMRGRQLTVPEQGKSERFITPDDRVVEMRAAPLDEAGEAASVATLQDITDALRVEKLEARLERDVETIRQLRDLDRARKQLVEMATHELRTPMTPLRSATQMLLGERLGPLNPQQRQIVEMMSRNVERLSRLSTDMLSLARLDSGEQTLARVSLDCGRVAQQTAELFTERYRTAGVELNLTSVRRLQVMANPDALTQVLINLLENALVHAEATEVKVSSRGVDDVWGEVVVRDNGRGIPAQEIPMIFERFRQLNRRRGPGYQGSGLGLALCKELVKRMEGQIVVESTVGSGTRFRVRLQRARLPEIDDVEDSSISVVLERPSRKQRRQQMREILLRSRNNRKKESGDGG